MASSKEKIAADKQLLKNLRTAEQKLKYYYGVQNAQEELAEALKQEIKRRTRVFTYWIFGFIPVITIQRLSRAEIARIEIARQGTEIRLSSIQNNTGEWKTQVAIYEEQAKPITEECNKNFDAYLSEARPMGKDDQMIRMAIDNYDREKIKGDQALKNEMYMFLKEKLKK